MVYGVIFIVVVGFIFLAVISAAGQESRSVGMIQQWTDQNGYQLISSDRKYMSLGTPFWAANDKRYTLHRITVKDANGNTRSGYALCRKNFALLSRKVEVKWD